ncbi:MAG: hypothetical protein K8R23_18055 [Chthoniobacter sp.]|nr:hypothetical protein [Chthoniobacter sp.]
MKLPENIRPFLIPAAWLATAAVTFGLGRLSSFVDSPPEKSAPVTTPGSPRGAVAGLDSAPGDAGWRTLPGAGGSPATLEELTGGKPMGDWLKHLLSQDDEVARMTGFMLLLDKLNTPEEIEAALAVVHASGGGRGDWGFRSIREASMLLQKWTKLDAKSAMAYAQKLEDRGAKFMGMNTVLQTWTRSNPQEAVAWAQANGTSQPNADGTTDRTAGNWQMTAVLDQLAKTDLGQALELAQKEPVSMARGRTIQTLVSQLVSQRGETAAREAALAITDDSMRAAMIRQLAGRAAETDPAGAMEWVSSLPAGASKTSALAETVGQWARKDATAAATYMATLPAGIETDEPRARFARSIVRTDPTSAIAWSNTITDPKARTESLGDVVGSWMRSDADAAKKWVATSQLPEETKKEILTVAAQRGPDWGGRGGNGGPGRRGP